MICNKLGKGKNYQTTWLMIVVLFLTGLSFSFPSAYAKEERVKVRTELVYSTKLTSRRSIAPESYLLTKSQLTVSFDYSIAFDNHISKLKWKEVNKAYSSFSLGVMKKSFLHRHQASTPLYLIA